MYKLRPLNIDISVFYTRHLTDGKNRFKNNLCRFKFLKAREKSIEFILPKFNYYFSFHPLPIEIAFLFSLVKTELHDNT